MSGRIFIDGENVRLRRILSGNPTQEGIGGGRRMNLIWPIKLLFIIYLWFVAFIWHARALVQHGREASSVYSALALGWTTLAVALDNMVFLV